MDVVWLKRDVRLHDHGPLAEVARSNDPFVLLYLYEPDQLREETVHGSHLRFIHEGLLDLEARLKKESKSGLERTRQVENSPDDEATTFEYLTICHNTAVATLTFVHQKHSIRRLLSHEETGHWQSYMRDRAVRKWCRANGVQFVEYNQTGVTRCLRNRDDYNKHWKAFVAKPRHPTPNAAQLRAKIVQLSDLPGFIPVLKTDDASHWNLIFTEIPLSHRDDRRGRQQHGGETKALATLDSFLQERGSRFSQDISSPNTAWNSCSRLSPYLAWGHVSLRLVVHSLQQRQEQLKQMKAQGRNTGTWLRSLQAFSSRLHWRSHFIQKLESEPTLEFRDLCPSYQHLRRQDGDWNEAHYNAWATGTTGFPFVDACMRCLMKHGWINFRMRAMLVSFACYNLWLDWKRIAPHLARVFLDFEPGIHYPQLQMQAGTTGINAMRVYSVTKQGKDQDPAGKFIRQHVVELQRVPDKYIHEPWRMPESLQNEIALTIVCRDQFSNGKSYSADKSMCYPEPIVDEQQTAKVAKTRLAEVRKQDATKLMSNEVFLKHGSRNRRSHEMNGRSSGGGSLPAVRKSIAQNDNQPKISDIYGRKTPRNESGTIDQVALTPPKRLSIASPIRKGRELQRNSVGVGKNKKLKIDQGNGKSCSLILAMTANLPSWSCNACTFLNENKPHALVCGVCGTQRDK